MICNDSDDLLHLLRHWNTRCRALDVVSWRAHVSVFSHLSDATRAARDVEESPAATLFAASPKLVVENLRPWKPGKHWNLNAESGGSSALDHLSPLKFQKRSARSSPGFLDSQRPKLADRTE